MVDSFFQSVSNSKCGNFGRIPFIFVDPCPLPTPFIDKHLLIGTAAGLLVAATPIGGMVSRVIGGVIVGGAVSSAVKKFLK